MKNRRVVVTGVGAVSSAGRTAESLWDAVSSGRSCVRALDFD